MSTQRRQHTHPPCWSKHWHCGSSFDPQPNVTRLSYPLSYIHFFFLLLYSLLGLPAPFHSKVLYRVSEIIHLFADVRPQNCLLGRIIYMHPWLSLKWLIPEVSWQWLCVRNRWIPRSEYDNLATVPQPDLSAPCPAAPFIPEDTMFIFVLTPRRRLTDSM